MSYIYKVFEHHKQLWMGIWQHTHTVTTTEVGQTMLLDRDLMLEKRLRYQELQEKLKEIWQGENVLESVRNIRPANSAGATK